MTDQGPNDFTEREKFILSYYRSPELSGSRRVPWTDVVVGVVSIVSIVMCIVTKDMGYGVAGYGLVIGRLFYLAIQGGRWAAEFRSIFTKYDAKLKVLAEVGKDKDCRA